MSKTISIIIPTLNEEKYLPRLLKNLTSQTSKDFDVVIVDGNSTDKTIKFAKEFSDTLSLEIKYSKVKKVAHQRNMGAQSAHGKYILFIDADMHIENSFIDNLLKEIKKNNYLLYLPVHIPYDAEYVDELLVKVMNFFTDASQITNTPFAYGPGAMFERHFFEHLGGYDEKAFVYEDHEIIQRAHKMGVKAKLLGKDPLYFSFRRFQSEGRIKVLSKNILAVLHLLAYGKVDRKIFSYDQGGNAKYLLNERKKFDLQKNVVKYFDSLKKLLEE